MPGSRKSLFAALALLALTLGSAANAQAVPISFTFQGTGTGTAGAQSFTNSSFTITLTTDTTLVTQLIPGGFLTPTSPTTITIAGVGSGSFLTPVYVSNVQGSSAATLTRGPGILLPDILAVTNAAFATYNLQTNLGPLSVSLLANDFSFLPVETTLGTVNFTSLSNLTFTAQTGAPVPEPATMILLTTGLAGVSAAVRRRRNAHH